jgi:glycogen debranching enzyme
MSAQTLLKKIYLSMLSLATEEGINASGKQEIYGCIFGRDSFITILKLLKVYSNVQAKNVINTEPFREISRRALLHLTTLQGKETNLESGEEPGKFIHEYRKENYDHLVNRPVRPWFLYPDKIMRNYDSIDSTPLGLIAIHRYWSLTHDDTFLLNALSAIEAGLNWIITYGDKDKDQLLEYELPITRMHGGLQVQSWTDSRESLLQADGSFPMYPIAPVEVQGYAWLALKLWADFYESEQYYAKTEKFSQKLRLYADQMKKRFNEKFFFETEKVKFAAQALDGSKKQIKTITGNPLLLLWATYENQGKKEAIIDDVYIPDVIKRAFMPDMFDPRAGIRTMSTKSRTYIPGQNSYHSGSFWPKLNGMSHEGLVMWGYETEAKRLKDASLQSIEYFGTPIELYVLSDSGEYQAYRNERGQQGCREQAWSAAATLDLITL